ncbi:type 1 glutamine amidotransferase [Actibacterium sp. D379-3]
MTTPPRIGILEVGRPSADLLQVHGDYIAMVADWIAPLGGQTQGYAVMDGAFPPGPDAADLWIITGSKCGVYEDHPWIPPLEAFIRKAKAGGQKMVGICFGHQIMAQALGGTVAKSDKGWGIGIHHYPPQNWPADLGAAPDDITIQAFHQDQITVLPPAAQVIAASDFCGFGMLWYPGFGVSFQGHPEFGKAYATDLLRARSGSVLDPAQVATALAGMDRPTTRDALALWLRDHWREM